MKATLLIEIGVEELPPKAMRRLADALADGLGAGLAEAGLAHGGVTRHATPRRLAVVIAQTPAHTEPSVVEKAGPTIAIAYDNDGNPTAAAQGFARSVGVAVDQLEHEHGDKGERLVYRATEPGKTVAEVLQPTVDSVLRTLPIPKRMRWGDSEIAFVRPVHWVVALHGNDVVALDIFGERAGNTTYGHRFHHPRAITLTSADDYAARLRDPGFVLTDPDERKQRVIAEVTIAAEGIGGHALIEDALAEEVTALVEWPVGIAGRFDERFLDLPREVLVATLQGHQRYFPVENESGDLMAGFVTVANIESRDVAQVIAGNERVVRPRLADALFFWEQDRRQGLAAHIEGLARVSFQNELGSLADKSARVRTIAARIAPAFDGAEPAIVDRAAVLAKTDLLTEMVGEFPELQGLMGHYYALDAGEDAAVAAALAEQYAPAGAGAAIAASPAGRVLAVADRLDTLAGIFAIDKRPSGDKDPFALRRAALGVLRTLIEADIDVDLAAALAHAIALQPVAAATDTFDALWMFHMERLRGYYAEQGFGGDRFDAVAALNISELSDFDRRLRAVDGFLALPQAPIVCGAHKRIRNILRRNERNPTDRFHSDALVEAAEHALASTLSQRRDSLEAAVVEHRYDQALAGLVDLAQPLDAFFDQVMVMSEDETLRHNRLAMLAELDALCRRVADISRLAPE